MSNRKKSPTDVLSIRISVDLKKRVKELTPEQNEGLHNKIRKLVEKETSRS